MIQVQRYVLLLSMTLSPIMDASAPSPTSQTTLQAKAIIIGLSGAAVLGGLLACRYYKASKRSIQQLAIIRPFISNGDIETIKKTMDDIETRKLGYPDYAKRTGLIWSDVAVKSTDPVEITKEFATEKVTLVADSLQQQHPQSILSYPAVQSIVCKSMFPKMLATIKLWRKGPIPATIFAQIFFQRCNMSEAMDWHQDPGEDYHPQANYSLVLMMSNQDDPKYGWDGGIFKIKPSPPTAAHDESSVTTVLHRYNQAVLFNNQENSHSVTAVTTRAPTTKRDLMVITLSFDQLPTKA